MAWSWLRRECHYPVICDGARMAGCLHLREPASRREMIEPEWDKIDEIPGKKRFL